MGGDEWSAALQATPHLFEGAQPLLALDEVKGQDAGCAIERAFWCAMDETLVKPRPTGVIAEGGPSKVEHCSGGIHPDERPFGLSFGEQLEFKAATSTDNQHMGVCRSAFREEEHGHSLHVSIAWHQARRVLSIAGNSLRVGERSHRNAIA